VEVLLADPVVPEMVLAVAVEVLLVDPVVPEIVPVDVPEPLDVPDVSDAPDVPDVLDLLDVIPKKLPSVFLTVETMETVPDKPSKCVEAVLPPSARPALEYSLGTVPTLNLLIA